MTHASLSIDELFMSITGFRLVAVIQEGWRWVLKAAIKKFKARQRRTRQSPLLQMILPTM